MRLPEIINEMMASITRLTKDIKKTEVMPFNIKIK
jgi:hypothetical protein